MKIFLSSLSLLWFTVTSPSIVQAQGITDSVRVCRSGLSTAINQVVNRPELRRSHWGIEVKTLESNRTIFSLNSEQFFVPASSVKLLTSAAGLLELGESYSIATPLYSVGIAPNLTSLRFYGQGSPNITTHSLKDIVHQLQKQGIARIENLIIDDSYLAPPLINPTWEWLDVRSYFATGVSSTILNQNTVTLTLLPQEVSEPVKHFWSDAIAARQWQLDNRVLTGEADQDYRVELDGSLGQPRLIFRGELGVNAAPDAWDLAVVDPAQYFLESLRQQLVKEGIKVVRGTVINQPQDNLTENKLMTIYSPAMAEIITEINQESNNLYAEVLGKILAKKLDQSTAADAVKFSLNKLNISPQEYVLVDTSGLSRQNLVTPQLLVKILRSMSQLPLGKSYQQSLAAAGVSGTLSNRFKNTSLEGNLWGKTGGLTGVASLSGYIINSDYPDIVFSIIVNNSDLKGREIRQAIDEIMLLIDQFNKC
ncbi:MAG: D-alanyl-D-alanine carboxypeptidase/D-alanyl-D-alanine-endopeptidase [Cyanobacteria bacterium J06621_8]